MSYSKKKNKKLFLNKRYYCSYSTTSSLGGTKYKTGYSISLSFLLL